MTIALSPEFRLVAAACAWPPGPARNARVAARAAGVDWPLCLRLARRHRVEGLVWAGLSEASVSPPPEVAAELRGLAQSVARNSLASAAESARLQRGLAAAGVDALVMKGTAVEMLAYRRLGLKSAWDIDLLVTPSAVLRSMTTLEGLGYRVSEPEGLSPRQFATWVELAKECELRHVGSGMTVELHWRLADGPSLLPGLDADGPQQSVGVSGRTSLTAFAREPLYAYLCVHGAMHGWSRLKWLADLAALLSHESSASVEQLHRQSLSLGAGRCSAQALLLCRDLLDLELTPRFEAELRGDPVVRWLVWVAMITLSDEREVDARRFAATRVLIAQLFLGGDLRHALAELRYRAVSLHDQVYLPLPRALRFLYPVLRLPLWILRRLRNLLQR